jgi:prepilin-type N-terminal cleavage/methylation domain-containing protein
MSAASSRASLRGASAREERGSAGFTLVELVVVLVIVGVMLAFVVPSLDRLSPKYTLRAAVRDVGSIIDLARGTSVTKNRRTAIQYYIANNAYRMFGPPDQEQQEGQGPGPWHLWPAGSLRTLPKGVHFRAVQPIGEAVNRTELAVRFDPLSTEGSHIVYLENDEGKLWSIKYNALLGVADCVEGEAVFEGGE